MSIELWVVFFMNKVSCILVAYSELQMRRTLKPFKFVLFSLQYEILLHSLRLSEEV